MKNGLFGSCGHCWIFQICWLIECSTFTVSSFRILNSSTGIPLPPLALFAMMRPTSHLFHIPGCLALNEWLHHRGFLGHEDLFWIVFLCILATSSSYLLLLSFIEPIFAWNVPLVSLILLKRYLSFPFYCSLFLCSDHWGNLSYLSWFIGNPPLQIILSLPFFL